jgi:phosphoglycolate phosphatase-like HAD superfamily hydrolase
MPLWRLLDRVRATPGALVVFDLDSTLIDTAPRHLAILREFAARPDAPARFRDLVAELTHEHMGWNPIKLLREHAVVPPEMERQLRKFWAARFLASDYLHHDLAMPGAREYVQAVHDAGAHVVYLTGRDEPGMGAGTRASLELLGFPHAHERVLLRLKPRPSEDDASFKLRESQAIAALGPVLGAFENEPRNANIFAEAFPQADVFLLETVCSPDPPPLAERVLRVRDYRR